jgi:DNA invertase Pin-like site-specific DNA recombinase
MYTQMNPTQNSSIRVARIYLRCSTDEQNLDRQEGIEKNARASGFYVAGVYREKASGARADRPELLRLISDLQSGEILIAERVDRISRLPLPEAESLVKAIRAKGARLVIPGLVDLEDLAAASTDGVTKIVLEAVQELLLKIALQAARDDYQVRRERQKQGIQIARQNGKYSGRRPDTIVHERIIALRAASHTIKATASLAGCSISQVKRIFAMHQANPKNA